MAIVPVRPYAQIRLMILVESADVLDSDPVASVTAPGRPVMTMGWAHDPR
jgi:hypothetical protein